MSYQNLTTNPGKLILGNSLLILCFIFYLIWWTVTFRPHTDIRETATGWILLPAILCAFAGIGILIQVFTLGNDSKPAIPGWIIIIGGILVYILLMNVTKRLFHRPVTSELFIIIIWTMMVAQEMNVIWSLDLASSIVIIGMGMGLFLAVVISLIAYVLYYRLGQVSSYVDGMIPLILAIVIMGVINIFLYNGR